jgi:hypothetical protein
MVELLKKAIQKKQVLISETYNYKTKIELKK